MIDKANRVGGPERLPIKLIMPKQGKEGKIRGGGGPPKPFREVNEEYRNGLLTQLKAVTEVLSPHLQKIKAAPVRINLISKATAKTHRPKILFSDLSCPIIGVGRPNELFIKVTTPTLAKLSDAIRENDSEQVIKELSCIESIEIITPVLRRKGLSSEDVLRSSPRSEKGFMTRVRLFDFGHDVDQQALVENFHSVCASHGIELNGQGYSPHNWTYAAECRHVKHVEELSRIVGVRSISHMPLIRTIRPRTLTGPTFPVLPSRDMDDGDLPVVVIVDSGISRKIPELSSWVVGSDSHVAPAYENADHGTFVAGLVCFGHLLNPTLPGLDSGSCAVFDLQVIPNDDPDKGDISALMEQEFLISLDSALQSHSNSYRVWNLSLGTDEVCALDSFSELAVELDNLQERYNVSFVISAGNYSTMPLLEYPRTGSQLTDGRITTPADSVLGITVGSISHVDYPGNGPKQHHPSSFSRHGAGPNHIIKPDVVHYGGSCSLDGSSIHGIRSLMDSGFAEDVGTSFAAPLVSRTLAQIYHQITPTPSPVLARALLTHHARDPRSGLRVPKGEENFLGFGLPAPVPYCLECTPHMATLVFEDVLRPGFYLEWDDFPYPTSLKRAGRYFGEVWMTLAYAPARGSRWGIEYCETHIAVHLGVYHDQISKTTGEVKQKFKGLVPPEHRTKGEMYESFQVEQLRKWAPVRTYHKRLDDDGERGNRWRLKLQPLTRHGVEREKTFKPQPFALMITIADPEGKAPIYDEMAQTVRTRFQSENLALRPQARVHSILSENERK